MRCHICDIVMEPNEIEINEHTGEVEPCSICKDIIFENAKYELTISELSLTDYLEVEDCGEE